MQKSALSRSFRKTNFRIHTWIGLHLCIALGLIFFTGTLLMFSPELKTFTQPSLWISQSGNSVTVGQLYDTTRSNFPERRIDSIGSQPRPWLGRPVYFTGKHGSAIAHVNPYSGEVIGLQKQGKINLRNIIRKLHDSLLVPINIVHVLVNALSFVVLILVFTGLVTYRKFWTGFFKPISKDAKGLPRQSALHRRIAIWAAPFLIVSTLASSVFFLNAIGFKARPASPPEVSDAGSPTLPQDFDGDQLDALLASCKKELPGLVESGVKFPKPKQPLIVINGYDNTVGKIFGGVTCYAKASTGTVAGIVRASDGNRMTQLKSLAVAVHYGSFGGWFSIVLWALFGAASTYVAISGARVFAARRIAKASTSGTVNENRSTVSLLVQGLGYFKWLYLVWLLGALALLIRDLI